MKARPGLICAFIIFVFVLLSGNSVGQVKADKGVLDARQWNFAEERLPLTGRWSFYENELLSPEECNSKKTAYSYFPSLWNDNPGNAIGQGYATYCLKVLVTDTIKTFSLQIPQLYSSCKLWVNDKLLFTAGKVGTTKDETVPQWINQIVSFTDPHDTLSIVLQIANFHHNKGGMKSSIYLGTPQRIQQHWKWEAGSNLAEIIFTFLEGVIFLIIYLTRRNKKVILFFSLLCFTWSLRAGFSNLYPVVSYFPDFNWKLLVKIEYLTLYGGMVFSILFLNLLFRNVSKPIISYLLIGINIFFIVFTLVTSPLAFSRWVNVYLTVAGVTVAYCSIIVIQALMYEQIGAWFLLFSLLMGAMVFGYDIAAYETATGYNLILLHFGYVVMFMLVTVGLLLHLDILKTKFGHSDILTYNDMFGKEQNTGKRKEYN